jgi:hypothetical protein
MIRGGSSVPANLGDITVGKPAFIERHGLWTDEQKEAVHRIKAEIETRGLDLRRPVFRQRRVAALFSLAFHGG